MKRKTDNDISDDEDPSKLKSQKPTVDDESNKGGDENKKKAKKGKKKTRKEKKHLSDDEQSAKGVKTDDNNIQQAKEEEELTKTDTPKKIHEESSKSVDNDESNGEDIEIVSVIPAPKKFPLIVFPREQPEHPQFFCSKCDAAFYIHRALKMHFHNAHVRKRSDDELEQDVIELSLLSQENETDGEGGKKRKADDEGGKKRKADDEGGKTEETGDEGGKKRKKEGANTNKTDDEGGKKGKTERGQAKKTDGGRGNVTERDDEGGRKREGGGDELEDEYTEDSSEGRDEELIDLRRSDRIKDIRAMKQFLVRDVKMPKHTKKREENRKRVSQLFYTESTVSYEIPVGYYGPEIGKKERTKRVEVSEADFWSDDEKELKVKKQKKKIESDNEDTKQDTESEEPHNPQPSDENEENGNDESEEPHNPQPSDENEENGNDESEEPHNPHPSDEKEGNGNGENKGAGTSQENGLNVETIGNNISTSIDGISVDDIDVSVLENYSEEGEDMVTGKAASDCDLERNRLIVYDIEPIKKGQDRSYYDCDTITKRKVKSDSELDPDSTNVFDPTTYHKNELLIDGNKSSNELEDGKKASNNECEDGKQSGDETNRSSDVKDVPSDEGKNEDGKKSHDECEDEKKETSGAECQDGQKSTNEIPAGETESSHEDGKKATSNGCENGDEYEEENEKETSGGNKATSDVHESGKKVTNAECEDEQKTIDDQSSQCHDTEKAIGDEPEDRKKSNTEHIVGKKTSHEGEDCVNVILGNSH